MLNPASQSATPLSINLPRLALTPEQRTQYREVLVYLDKSQGGSARSTSGEAKHTVRLNVSELESEWEEEDEDDEGSGVDELQESTALLHIQPMPERNAPVGMMAQAALESRSSLSRMSSPASNIAPSSSDGDQQTREETSGGGIGNADYFSPGTPLFFVWGNIGVAHHAEHSHTSRIFILPRLILLRSWYQTPYCRTAGRSRHLTFWVDYE